MGSPIAGRSYRGPETGGEGKGVRTVKRAPKAGLPNTPTTGPKNGGGRGEP